MSGREIREVFGNGKNLLLCGSVMKPPAELKALSGKAQCVYLDPPFMTGKKFSRKRPYGERGWKRGTPVVTLPGFEDAFENQREYMRLLRKMISFSRELLSESGVFYLHLDWRMVAHARLLCDRAFGAEQFLNEIIWGYESGGRTRKCFPRKHDTILMYAKGKNYRFDLTRLPLSRAEKRRNHMARGIDEEGRTYSSIVSHGREYRYYDDEPVYPGDVWTDISILQQRDPERTGYATQKPLKLLDRLLRPVSEAGDLVVDLCCGSGTTLQAAQELGCDFAGMDIDAAAIAVTLARLKPENLTVVCPAPGEAAELLASYDEKAGRLRVEGLRLPDEDHLTDPEGNLESWDAGAMEKGIFRPWRSYRRSFQYPALVDSLQVSPEEIPPAILATDAAGRRHLFRWNRETQKYCLIE